MIKNDIMITSRVNCKINIGLNVIRKRPDGYHDIETVFYPIDNFQDIITLSESEQSVAFQCDGTQDAGSPEDNLCLKAFRLLEQDYGIQGVKIHLEKHIPTGAGLGGGSADAAFTLKITPLAPLWLQVIAKTSVQDIAYLFSFFQ